MNLISAGSISLDSTFNLLPLYWTWIYWFRPKTDYILCTLWRLMIEFRYLPRSHFSWSPSNPFSECAISALMQFWWSINGGERVDWRGKTGARYTFPWTHFALQPLLPPPMMSSKERKIVYFPNNGGTFLMLMIFRAIQQTNRWLTN
jgi:hypothetical protein